MARAGEGDQRWIVADRADGTNVNAWHWVEHDALEWCRHKLAELFTDLPLPVPAGSPVTHLAITGVDSVTGEAVVNNRKQKIIPSYELEVKLAWQGTAAGAQVQGKVHLPYIADENHDEEPELRFAVEQDNAASKACKEAFLKGVAKQEVVGRVGQFVAALRAGGPMQPGAKQPQQQQRPAATPSQPAVESAHPAAQQLGGKDTLALSAPSTATPAPASTSDASSGKAVGGSSNVKKAGAPVSKRGSSSLLLKEQFYARAGDLYECFVHEGRIRAFTQSAASVQPQSGGAFSWFGGSVQGVFRELEPGKRLVMDWRFSSWEEGCTSQVVLCFEEPEPGHTFVHLEQTRIPAADKFGNEDVYENTEKGWRTQIFQRIRQVFGFGLGL